MVRRVEDSCKWACTWACMALTNFNSKKKGVANDEIPYVEHTRDDTPPPKRPLLYLQQQYVRISRRHHYA